MKRCVSLCVYCTAVIVIVCYCVTILKCYWPAPTLLELTIYMPSKELATVCTCTLVLQIAGTSEQTEAEGSGGGPNVGGLGATPVTPTGSSRCPPLTRGFNTRAPYARRAETTGTGEPAPTSPTKGPASLCHHPRASPPARHRSGEGPQAPTDNSKWYFPLIPWLPLSHSAPTWMFLFLCCRPVEKQQRTSGPNTRNCATWKPGQGGPAIWSSSIGWGASTRCPPWW